MKMTEQRIASRAVQGFVCFFFCLYLYFTYETYPMNTFWFTVSLALALLSYFQNVSASMFAALLVLLAYGGYFTYQWYFGLWGGPNWNDMLWVFLFPFASVAGALFNRRNEEAERVAKRLQMERKRLERESLSADETMELDEKLDIAARDAFFHRFGSLLSESPQRGVLLLIEIQYYWDFKDDNGYEQTKQFLEAVAETIRQSIPDAHLCGYVGGGMFAAVFEQTDIASPKFAEIELSHRYNAMLLTRPRREGSSRARLRFGAAEYPEHGLDVPGLWERAKQELEQQRLRLI